MAVIANARTIRLRYDGRNGLTIVERSTFHYSALPRLFTGTKFTSYAPFSKTELPKRQPVAASVISLPLVGNDTDRSGRLRWVSCKTSYNCRRSTMKADAPRPQLSALTSLRFFAALHVVLFPLYALNLFAGTRFYHSLAPIDYFLVSFVFIRSGFIRVYTYADRDFTPWHFWLP